MKINPNDPAHHGKPLWVVYGHEYFPSLLCAELRAYGPDWSLLQVGDPGPIVCIWGYSISKGVSGFRTIGRSLWAWAEEQPGMDPVFFDDQEEALALLRELTTPAPSPNSERRTTYVTR